MNKVVLMGRLTRDPEVRYSSGEKSMAIARYTLAVDRRGRRGNGNGEQTADFCCFGQFALFSHFGLGRLVDLADGTCQSHFLFKEDASLSNETLHSFLRVDHRR